MFFRLSNLIPEKCTQAHKKNLAYIFVDSLVKRKGKREQSFLSKVCQLKEIPRVHFENCQYRGKSVQIFWGTKSYNVEKGFNLIFLERTELNKNSKVYIHDY